MSVPPVNALVQAHLRPMVVEVVPLRRLRLRSQLIRPAVPGLFDVDLIMTITDRDGGVRLWQQDRFGGLLAPLLIRSLNRHRATAFAAMNEALKRRAEGMSPPEPADQEKPVSERRLLPVGRLNAGGAAGRRHRVAVRLAPDHDLASEP